MPGQRSRIGLLMASLVIGAMAYACVQTRAPQPSAMHLFLAATCRSMPAGRRISAAIGLAHSPRGVSWGMALICDRDLAGRELGSLGDRGRYTKAFARTERAVVAQYIEHLPHHLPVPLLLAIATRLSDAKTGGYSEDTWISKSDFTTRPLRVIARRILKREFKVDEGFDAVKWQHIILKGQCN